MHIIIAGGGKIGRTLARQLTSEGHDITIIDLDPQVLESAQEHFDAMTFSGNCASMEVLLGAGVKESDLLIATTGEDEVNLLCCMTAHGINENLHTIARIRNPAYTEQVMSMRKVFPLSLTVNPEKQTATEIARLLRYPGFLRRDTFAKGRAEIVELRVEEGSKLCNIPLSDLAGIVKCKVLVCAVLRSGNAVAPSGNFVLKEGDRIFVTAPTDHLATLLKNLGILTRRVQNVILCGGGRVSYYLAKELEKNGIFVKILEKDPARCLTLAAQLPQCDIVQENCSDQSALESQGIRSCDALVTLTGNDSTNMVVSLCAQNRGVPQVITKISRAENLSLGDTMALGSMVCPRELCSNIIVHYVRAMQNQTGAAVSVHSIADGQAEAVEFLVDENTRNLGVPLRQMKLRPNVLVASITHHADTQIPGGDSVFRAGDTVVVVTSGRGVLQQLGDIFG